MKKHNQQGFTVVEGILIFVIVAVIGGIGWYVWKQNDSKKSSQNGAQQAAAGDGADGDGAGSAGCTAPEGYSVYTNNDIGYCFAYPTSWGTVTLHDGVIDPAYEPDGAFWGSFSDNTDASFAHVTTDWEYTGPGRGGPINATGFTVYELYVEYPSTPSSIKINNADKQLVASNSMLDIEGAIVTAKHRFTSTPSYAGIEFRLNVPGSGGFNPESDNPDTLVTPAQYTIMETILNSVVEL